MSELGGPQAASARLVVAADGGNSKTDLVLATELGDVLAHVQSGGTHPHIVGMAATMDALAELARQAVDKAGLGPDTAIAAGTFYLANVDVPDEGAAALSELQRLRVAADVQVRNDVFAVLRAGSTRGWGVAVVSGAGINAAGVHPDGREERFLAIGDVSGDWGGGLSVGMAGLGAAVRFEDGRGPATVLHEMVIAHFGESSAQAVALRVHRESDAAVLPLAPVVFRAATDGDEVARNIVERLADEVVTMALTLLRRLDLLTSDADVVLGGGTLQSGNEILLERVRSQLYRGAPAAVLRVLDVPPVAGALAGALDLVDASPAAHARARAAVARPS
jgi:N-acetylglucosamine kinase-like BadF-type ATPase